MYIIPQVVILGFCCIAGPLSGQTTRAVVVSPQVFAPGAISGPAHDASPAFTPDGLKVYFSRGNTSSTTILVSHRQGSSWSQPGIAPFSGQWEDMESTMAPDGSYMLFVSNRPFHPGDKLRDGFYNGRSWPGRGSALWRVNRASDGWSEPTPLSAIINDGPTIFAPSVTANGSVYFMKPDGPKNKFRLFRAEWNGASFAAPVPLPFSTGADTDVDPAVAADESFLVFGSSRPPALASTCLSASETMGLGERRNTWATSSTVRGPMPKLALVPTTGRSTSQAIVLLRRPTRRPWRKGKKISKRWRPGTTPFTASGLYRLSHG